MKDEDRTGVQGGQFLQAKPVESQTVGSSVGNSFAISAKGLKHAYITYLGVPLLGISSEGIIRGAEITMRMRTLRIILMEKMRNCAEYEVK